MTVYDKNKFQSMQFDCSNRTSALSKDLIFGEYHFFAIINPYINLLKGNQLFTILGKFKKNNAICFTSRFKRKHWLVCHYRYASDVNKILSTSSGGKSISYILRQFKL